MSKTGRGCYTLDKREHIKKESKLEDVKVIEEESGSLAAANKISTDPAVSGLDCTFTLTDENTTVDVLGGKCVFTLAMI